MNFRRLKYFVKIVDIGSLTQAAEVLHIAQPALSQQVVCPCADDLTSVRAGATCGQ